MHLVAFQTSDQRAREKTKTLLRSYGWEIIPGLFECPIPSTQAEELKRILQTILPPEGQARIYQICRGCRTKFWHQNGPDMVTSEDFWIF